MCKAARTVSIYNLIPDLKRKHKSQKLHFRPFGWCQMEEINTLRKSLMSHHNCFSFHFSYTFHICLLSHLPLFHPQTQFCNWYHPLIQSIPATLTELSWNWPYICFRAHSMQNLTFFQNVLSTTPSNSERHSIGYITSIMVFFL
jgi:hypothetical protein